MIKTTAICDRCKYEQNISISSLPIPERWETFGICPKYLLCPTCSCSLKSKISDLTYIYVGNPNKKLLMQIMEE